MYAVCDGRDEHGHQCPAFVAPAPHGDPSGPGHVFSGYLDLTRAGEAAGWDMRHDRTLCPEHCAGPRPEAVVDVVVDLTCPRAAVA